MSFDTDELKFIMETLEKEITTRFVGQPLTEATVGAVQQAVCDSLAKYVPMTLKPETKITSEDVSINADAVEGSCTIIFSAKVVDLFFGPIVTYSLKDTNGNPSSG